MTSVNAPHEPVLRDRVVELLAVAERGVLVDATLGAGGHAEALLAASGPDVTLVGFDRDPEALALATERLARFGDRVVLVHARFDALAEHVAPVAAQAGPVLGVLYDLGVSSMQLDRPERGFSFRGDGPLDMRMDPTRGATAADLVNTAEADELTALLREYGEERHARRIVAAIVRARPLATTAQLADVVTRAVPTPARHGPISPATRTFQALRIAVNAELDTFRASLPQALDLAPPAGPSGSLPPALDLAPSAAPSGSLPPALDLAPSAAPSGSLPPALDLAPSAAPSGSLPPALDLAPSAAPSGSLPPALDLAPSAAETGSPRHPNRGGRVAVLAYHSGEDRIAKRVFADAARGCICPPDLPVCACGRTPWVRQLTRGAETPGAAEVARNPRARSARLRAVEVVGEQPER